MEQVKKFDETLEKVYHNEFQMNRIGAYMFMVLGAVFMLIPASLDNIIFLYSNGLFLSFFLDFALDFYLAPYMRVRESGKTVSIYQKLKWMPVQKKEIQAVRKEYLNRICLKLLPIYIIVQQIVALLTHSWSFLNLLYPVIIILLSWCTELREIYFSKR